jgi:hypothetical protein
LQANNQLPRPLSPLCTTSTCTRCSRCGCTNVLISVHHSDLALTVFLSATCSRTAHIMCTQVDAQDCLFSPKWHDKTTFLHDLQQPQRGVVAAARADAWDVRNARCRVSACLFIDNDYCCPGILKLQSVCDDDSEEHSESANPADLVNSAPATISTVCWAVLRHDTLPVITCHVSHVSDKRASNHQQSNW